MYEVSLCQTILLLSVILRSEATKNLKTSPVRKRFFALLRMTRDLRIAVATDAMYGVPTFPQSA